MTHLTDRDKAAAEQIAAAAPPLTEDQMRRLREILRHTGFTAAVLAAADARHAFTVLTSPWKGGTP